MRLIMHQHRKSKFKTSALWKYKYSGCPIPTVEHEHDLLQSSILRTIKMFLPWCFSQNEVELQRNTCSLSAYYAVLTGNLLPTFRTKVCCLHLQVVQEDSFECREDECVIDQNYVIFVSRTVEITNHTPTCLCEQCCLYEIFCL